MKKLLLLLKEALEANLRYFSTALLLIVLLAIGKSGHAQVYYVTNDAASGSASAQDGFIKINYDGTGKTSLGSSVTNSPGIMAIDLPHDRAFVYEQFSTSPPTNLSIKVVTLSTGALIKTITFTQAARIAALKYDAVNDYIYYVLQDSAPTTVSATNDALCRVKPDGTGQTVLLAGFCKNPGPMALDIPNNRLFVMENLNADRAFLTISLASNTVTQTSSTISVTGIAGVYADYDPDTNFIYLLSSDNTVNTSATDAIYKLHPDGSGFVSVKGSIGSRPITGAFDFPHGKAYFFDNNTTRQLNSMDLTSGTITELANINTYPTNAQITGIAVPSRPVVSTTSASNISSTSATLAGNVVESDVSVTDRGVVYSSTNSTPTIGSTGVTQAANGTGTGSYSASIGSLSATTTYYVRAYAISTAGTAYGAVSSFTTLSNDATLSGLSLSAGSLNPSFSSGTITYTASVANSNSTITVTPIRNNANASIKVQGTSVNSGSASGNISLAIGDNAISTVVTAQDGSTTKTYTVTVNRPKASQTITFNALSAKNYGNSDFSPGASASSGLGVSYTSDNTAVATIVGGNIHIVAAGTANIIATQGGDANNLAATAVSQSLIVNKAAVTVTATAASKTYGNSDPSLAYTITTGALVGADAFTGTLTRDAGVNVGNYNITKGTLALSANYTLSFIGNTFTINAKTVNVAANAQTKTYGDADPTLTYTADALISGDSFTGTLSRVAGEAVGAHAINRGSLALSSNYTISYTGNTLTIGQKTINVTANAQTKTYGDADPALTYTADALVSGDSFSGALTRVAGEGVGIYAINKGSLALSSNYTVSYTGNNLTIGQKTINVTANAQTKTYGDADPALTYTADALVSGDTFSGSLTRDAGETVGTYNITKGSLALNANYALNYTGNSLIIDKATLSYVATPASKNYLAVNPAFTGTVTGFVSGDTQASATTGTLSFTSTATASSPVGSYPITGAGLSAVNYNFIQAPANNTALSIALSSDASLSNLSISQGTFNTPFNATTYQYFASVANSVTSFDLTAVANQANATITVNGTILSSGLATTLLLSAGSNNFTIVVTAQDGTTTQSYLLGINRALSSNNLLSNITMSGVTLNPAFDSGTLSYTASVGNLVDATDITATPADNNAVAQVGSNRISTVTSYHQSLIVGNNVVTVTGIAQNGDTRDYVITITRAPSSDASLSAINTTGFSLIETFSGGIYNYTANVTSGVAQVTFVPVSTNNGASIAVNGTVVNSSGYSATLNFGVNTYNVVVNAQDGATANTYTLKITRALSSDATLSSLSIPYVTTINESFDPAVLNYTANLADSTITGLPLSAISNDVNATVKINGDAVARFTNYVMALHGGSNTFNIVVTPQDNSATKTYTLVLTRAGQAPPVLSPDASLAAISVSGTGYSHNFNFAFDALTPLTVPNKTTAIRLHPVTGNTGATTTVNNVAIAYDASTDLLPLNEGDNVFNVVVTAADGVHQTTTTLHVNRLPAADISLASLTLNAGTLSPAFVGTTLTYTASVPNSVSNLIVTPIASAADATVTVGGTTISAGTPSANVPLNVGGANYVRITVTAADGVNTQTYTVNVTRSAPDASLASVSVSGGSSVTHPTATTYATQVNYNTAMLTVTPTAVDPGSAITVDGNTVVSGSASAGITLDNTPGATTIIPIVVTAPDGTTTQPYSLAVTHLAASSNATLAALNISSGILSPSFSPGTLSYTSPATSSESVTLTPTTGDENAVVTINGLPAVNGSPLSIPLLAGTNTITVNVNAQDGTTTRSYAVTITRVTLASNAYLKKVLSNVPYIQSSISGPGDENYMFTVGDTISSLTLSPIPQDAGAVIKVNGIVVANGAASGAIALSTNTTLVTIVLQAADGVTHRTYGITIKKGSSVSSNAYLKEILSNVPYTQSSINGTGDENYMFAVGNAISSLTLSPIPQDAGAVIKVNGTVVANGAASGPIALSTNTTAVTIVVQAANGVTRRTYGITVKKGALVSSNAYLKKVLSNVPYIQSSISGTGDENYMFTVGDAISSLTLSPISQDAGAIIKVNGVVVANGAASGAIALSTNTTAVTIVLLAADGVTHRTYSITIKKGTLVSSNAYLKKVLSNVPYIQSSISGTGDENYMFTVGDTISSLTLSPIPQDAGAVIKVNGIVVANGTASSAIALSTNTTAVTIALQAADGVTRRTYGITISKAASINATNSLVEKLIPAGISVKPESIISNELIVHQALSPNGDGQNDILTIDGIENHTDNHLSIMNAGGTLVYDVKGYGTNGNVFDGHSNKTGAMQKPGTYYYSLEYNDGKETKRKTGFIIIKY